MHFDTKACIDCSWEHILEWLFHSQIGQCILFASQLFSRSGWGFFLGFLCCFWFWFCFCLGFFFVVSFLFCFVLLVGLFCGWLGFFVFVFGFGFFCLNKISFTYWDILMWSDSTLSSKKKLQSGIQSHAWWNAYVPCYTFLFSLLWSLS